MKKKNKQYSLDNIVAAGDDCATVRGIFLPQMIQKILSTNDTSNVAAYFEDNGSLIAADIAILEDAIIELGGALKLIQYDEKYFQWQDKSYLSVYHNETTKATDIYGYVFSDKLWEQLGELCEKHLSPITTNLVFVIVREQDKLLTRNIGNGSAALIEDNYSPKVIKEFNSAINTFQSSSPNGRIIILNGTPGTGKTHLIRALLSKLDNVFVIVPSGLVDALDKVDFMPLLLDLRDNYEKPICLIIEDGDVCLVPRENDNISSITALLNLSDGILGTMFDLRLVVSSNAKINEIDKAILRPGRLCKQIKVDALKYDHANKVYQRIVKNESVSLPKQEEYTLAEIYYQANMKENDDLGSEIKKAIGF